MGWHDHRGAVKETRFNLKPDMVKEDFNPYLKMVDNPPATPKHSVPYR